MGFFRSSLTGIAATQEDVCRSQAVFGYVRTYLIIVDAVQGAMSMYTVENGAARKVPSAMVENL